MKKLPPGEWAHPMQPSAHARYVFGNTQPISHPTFQDRFNSDSIKIAAWFGSGAQESSKTSNEQSRKPTVDFGA